MASIPTSCIETGAGQFRHYGTGLERPNLRSITLRSTNGGANATHLVNLMEGLLLLLAVLIYYGWPILFFYLLLLYIITRR